MKRKSLKILYDALNTSTIDKNPFRSRKIHTSFNQFLDQYISEAQQDEACNQLDHLCEACQKSAFQVRFDTAIDLINKS